MRSFSTHLQEVNEATAFESLIVCAYNGGPDKDPGVLEDSRISLDYYYQREDAATSIAKAIKTKCKPSGKAIHFGRSAGQVASWWDGRSTPKTDLFIGDVRISVKKAGGSQIMSAPKGETLSTFKAAMAFMDKDSPEEAVKLARRVGNALQEIVVPKNTYIGNFTKKIRDGENISKRLQPMAKKYIQRDKAKEKLTAEVSAFFEDHPTFRNWFVFEALTGLSKFSPDGPKGKAIANWVLKFDTNGNVHELEQLISKTGKPTPFVKKLAKNVGFRVSWKSGGAKRNKTSLALRVDIDESMGHIPTLDSILDEAVDEYQTMIAEGLVGKVSNWFKKLFKKIMNALMSVAKKGMGAVLNFLGLEISDLAVFGDIF